MNLPHSLDRTIVIQASPSTVFSFFTDNARWAAWWGQGSTIEPKSGGRVYIRYPNGIESSGQVVEVVAPERIVFTYGFDSGKPMPPGTSRVTIRLEPAGFATRLHLLHEFAETAVRDEHVQGWRYQLSVFGNVVTDLANANASDAVDTWFAAWSETDAHARTRQLASIVTDDVRFHDRFSMLEGIGDLVPHIGAAQRFMPDVHLRRKGNVRHCQGTLLVDWTATSGSGEARGSGINVFTLRADGKIETVTGFWVPEGRS